MKILLNLFVCWILEILYLVPLKWNWKSLENIERKEEGSLCKDEGEEEEQWFLLLGQDLLLLLLDLAGRLHLGEDAFQEGGERFGWQDFRRRRRMKERERHRNEKKNGVSPPTDLPHPGFCRWPSSWRRWGIEWKRGEVWEMKRRIWDLLILILDPWWKENHEEKKTKIGYSDLAVYQAGSLHTQWRTSVGLLWICHLHLVIIQLDKQI